MKTKKRISERKFETRLARLLTRVLENAGGHVGTFQDHGVLTENRGLVIELPNGQEFQLTIVDSARD